MSDSHFRSRRGRNHFALGVVLLLVGTFILASRLGFELPYEWWMYWPWLLLALGGIQLLLPGNFRDRMGGYWLAVAGVWGLINMYEVFGLDWGNSWPIFIIAAGVRMLLGAVFCPRAARITASDTPPKSNLDA